MQLLTASKSSGIFYMKVEAEWRNWQTRKTQNLVPERACGFDSHLGYQLNERGA